MARTRSLKGMLMAIIIILFPHFLTAAQQEHENVAKGRAYTMQPPPNYGLCTDAGDATQLTDGVFTEDYFWTQADDRGLAEHAGRAVDD